MTYPTDSIINILRKDYPEITTQIIEKINESLPEQRLTNISQVSIIISSFKKEKGLVNYSFQNQTGKKKVTDMRELLIAVVLMFYLPEKIQGLSSKENRIGLVNCLSELMECRQQYVSDSIRNAVSNYKIYRSFKEEVDRLYDIIKVGVRF